jgi:RES domain-containing protein
MPRAWRIVKERHASIALDGEGARMYGGRWNSPGVPVVYAADSRALATLEVLAGLGSATPLAAYLLIPLEFDQKLVASMEPTALPGGWNQSPPLPSSQQIGDAWVAGGTSPVLRVPSVLVPREFNYVFNPRHPGFSDIKVGRAEPRLFDPRLLV